MKVGTEINAMVTVIIPVVILRDVEVVSIQVIMGIQGMDAIVAGIRVAAVIVVVAVVARVVHRPAAAAGINLFCYYPNMYYLGKPNLSQWIISLL